MNAANNIRIGDITSVLLDNTLKIKVLVQDKPLVDLKNVTIVTPKSPLGQVLIGSKVGECVDYWANNLRHTVKILSKITADKSKYD